MTQQRKRTTLSIFVCAFIGICPVVKAIQDPIYINFASKTTPSVLFALVKLNQAKKGNEGRD